MKTKIKITFRKWHLCIVLKELAMFFHWIADYNIIKIFFYIYIITCLNSANGRAQRLNFFFLKVHGIVDGQYQIRFR